MSPVTALFKHLAAVLACTLALEAGAAPEDDFQKLDEETLALKRQVLELNRDLMVLEEQLIAPASTQIAVFVSIDVGTFVELASIELKLDGRQVASYLYTEAEAQALLKGGVQRLYVGNVSVGDHELVAVFAGKGPRHEDYRRGTTLTIDKTLQASFVELKISDLERRQEPEFQVRVWE